MDNSGLLVGLGPVEGRSLGLRMGSVLAALALIFTVFVLVQSPADATPATAAPVAASVAVVGGIAAQFGGVQIDVGELIRQIVCPILFAIRNAFARSPFFSFVLPILDQLLVAFGCVISPG